jgi:signal transduction histidine kinase
MSDQSVPASGVFALFDRARGRSQTALLQPLAFACVALVIAASIWWSRPRPSLHGHGLAVLLALAAITALTWRTTRDRPLSRRGGFTLFACFVLAAAALVWLQPGSLGVLALFVAVSAAGMRLPARQSGVIACLALAAYAVAELADRHRLPIMLAQGELGIAVFFALGEMGSRLRHGQEQAERLIAELQATRDAQARAAALAERARLAREMHDVLAHSLSGLALQLTAIKLLAESKGADQDITEALDRAHHLARAGIDEARRATGMLREEALPGPERLAALARELEEDSGVPCQVAVTGEARPLSAEARLALYRVAQEALTNIRKHARPRRVELRLAYRPDGTRLTVEDFGADGPPLPGDGSGYGLTGMRERAELLGGTLAAAPTASGFRVELWVPA